MDMKTSLFEEHVRLGGRMVPFGGWNMPVQYTGLAQEHEACRQYAGLFDVSHMGEVSVRGKKALAFLNHLVTNSVGKIKDQQAQYTVMCNPEGGCVDDLLVHRFNENDFLLCINASNTPKDFAWIEACAKAFSKTDLVVENESPRWAQIAVQGPQAQSILQKLTKTALSEIKYYWFTKGDVVGVPSIIARTGYTGEDGFEIYHPWEKAPQVWNALLEAGGYFSQTAATATASKILPCGLGARDTLRTEMKYPLYGHEISETLNPLEAGLGWVVKFDKDDFIGKKPLQALKEKGFTKSLVGLVTKGRGIPRQDYIVESVGASGTEAKKAGFVTSGTFSPSLKQGIAIAYVEKEFSKPGTELNLVIRDQRVLHEVVETPFYKERKIHGK